MVEERTSRRRPSRAFYALAAVLVAFLTAGCGAVAHMSADDGNPAQGKPLFKTHCGACHTLASAGTSGIVGPNLDTTFGIVRAQGFDESTIRDVVRGQIAYPETETAEGGPGMPANLVTGQDARDVADFVAECAQLPAQDAKDIGVDTSDETIPDACA
jgi:mono/diheme cytochrome c family protein